MIFDDLRRLHVGAWVIARMIGRASSRKCMRMGPMMFLVLDRTYAMLTTIVLGKTLRLRAMAVWAIEKWYPVRYVGMW